MSDAEVIIGFLSLLASLICALLSLNIGFKNTKRVEQHLDIPPNWIGNFVGEGSVGRTVRNGQITGYLLFRLIPAMRPRMERQLGQELSPIPLRVQLWATVPFLTGVLFFVVFLLATY